VGLFHFNYVIALTKLDQASVFFSFVGKVNNTEQSEKFHLSRVYISEVCRKNARDTALSLLGLAILGNVPIFVVPPKVAKASN
jgi:hypothetical protein